MHKCLRERLRLLRAIGYSNIRMTSGKGGHIRFVVNAPHGEVKLVASAGTRNDGNPRTFKNWERNARAVYKRNPWRR